MLRNLCRIKLPQNARSLSHFLAQNQVRNEVEKFDLNRPVTEATTPPSSWFTEPSIEQLDKV